MEKYYSNVGSGFDSEVVVVVVSMRSGVLSLFVGRMRMEGRSRTTGGREGKITGKGDRFVGIRVHMYIFGG